MEFVKRLLFVIVLSGIPVILFAQKDLRKGYIITNEGDTIHGMINFQSDIKNSEEIGFIPENGNNEVLYYPFDIAGYRLETGRFYVSRHIEGKPIPIFAEYLVRGQKDLFYYHDGVGPNFLVSNEDSLLITIPYKKELITIDEKSYQYESTQHIGFLKTYFSESPSVFDDIENMKEPRRDKLISITKEYHDVVCGENSCIIYKKQKYPFRIAIAPQIGIIKFYDSDSFANRFGGNLYIWAPYVNENVYFKTGADYSEYTYEIQQSPGDTASASIVRVPIQVSYIFPDKFIRPKFDAGFNVFIVNSGQGQPGLGMFLAASAGVLVRISKFTYLDLSVDSDLGFFGIFESTFPISYSVNAGLFLTY